MTPLPLFPLPIVACPREIVPLHIFEPRYREMIRAVRGAVEQGAPGEWVMVYSDGQHTATVGTVVKLVKVLKEYDDGRLDLLAQGTYRVGLIEAETETSYRMCRVDAREDNRGDWSETLANEAFNLHRALIQFITGTRPDDRLYAGTAQLSFTLAATLSLGVDVKQELIESRSEDDRLALLVAHMTDLMHKCEEVQMAARAIQGNWQLHQAMLAGDPPV
jgi:ATP-dependent Lon protease